MQSFDPILQKKLILVTGKGGIGKTTVAASLAQYARDQGKKVCLVESSSQDQIAPLFGREPIGHMLTEVDPNIFAINLEAAKNFRDFVVIHLGFAKLFEKVFTKAIVQSFIKMLPGVAELTLLGRLYYLAELDEKNNFDHVILDGYASGHFLSLLKTPDAVIDSGMVGPIIAESQRVKEFMFHPAKTGIVLVTVPESLIISEAIEFYERLQQELKVHPDLILVNRCLPSTVARTETENITQNLTIHEFLMKRSTDEKAQVARLIEALDLQRSRRSRDIKLQLLKDFGLVPEPLPPGFAGLWQPKGAL